MSFDTNYSSCGRVDERTATADGSSAGKSARLVWLIRWQATVNQQISQISGSSVSFQWQLDENGLGVVVVL